MFASRHKFEDEVCPVPDALLGEIYSASPLGLPMLAETVAPDVRAMLALFCYRRSHLHTVGLAIAATCDERDLVRSGGHVGAALFALSREAPQPPSAEPHCIKRRKITLAAGPARKPFPLDDEPDDELLLRTPQA
jgi:hypothetical protein